MGAVELSNDETRRIALRAQRLGQPRPRGGPGPQHLRALVSGRLAAAGRRGFERLYDLAERVIPPEVRALPTPSAHDAQRALILRAAGSLGVGSGATEQAVGCHL